MARRFLFVPWDHDDAGDYGENSVRMAWPNNRNTKNQKNFTKVYADTAGSPLDFPDGGNDVTIYVRGHGDSKFDYISRIEESDTMADACFPAGLFDSMVACGIKASFSGKIKLYNCSSAVGGNISFAAQVAGYFRQKGFNNARFFGYSGDVKAEYLYRRGRPMNQSEIDAGMGLVDHLGANDPMSIEILQQIDDELYAHKWVSIQGSLVRTSKARVAF